MEPLTELGGLIRCTFPEVVPKTLAGGGLVLPLAVVLLDIPELPELPELPKLTRGRPPRPPGLRTRPRPPTGRT
jgi:hypothetical protein